MIKFQMNDKVSDNLLQFEMGINWDVQDFMPFSVKRENNKCLTV